MRSLYPNPSGSLAERSRFRKTGCLTACFGTRHVCVAAVLLLACAKPPVTMADDTKVPPPPTGSVLTEQSNQWETWATPDGGRLHRRVLQIVPRADDPTLPSIDLIASDSKRLDGNAAIHYLQAMAFLEQNRSLRAIFRFQDDARQAAQDQSTPGGNFPPYSWLELPLEELPLAEVNGYLQHLSFQTHHLREAAKRRHCDFDRQIEANGAPWGIRVSEVQSMRDLLHMQILRMRLALAEDRVNDAIEVLGQIFAMGPHLAQDPLVLSSYVGSAIVRAGCLRAYAIAENHQAPNLYWSYAALPVPIVDFRHAVLAEQSHLYVAIPCLKEVNAIPQSDAYWRAFVDRFVQQASQSGAELREFDPSGFIGRLAQWDAPSAAPLAIALGGSAARQYLIDEEGMSASELEQLPRTQIFFLAMRRSLDRANQLAERVLHTPYPLSKPFSAQHDDFFTRCREYGPATLLVGLTPAMGAARTNLVSTQQQIAMLQTVESLRHHLATHNLQYPEQLSDLDLPAPNDPFTDQPFEYSRYESGVTLTGANLHGSRYQLVLRLSSPPVR